MVTQRKYVQCFSWGQFVQRYALVNASQGFALPMVSLLGIILITLMTSFLLGAHNTLQSSKVRQSASGSSLITDSAIARVMAELSKPENSVLLVRNYDPINPKSNRHYLGEDGILNSGDEQNTAVDEWSAFAPEDYQCFQEKAQRNPDIPLNGSIGNASGTYQILAYRYNPQTESGNVLIQGEHQGIKSQLLVSISVKADLDDFPGVGLIRPFKNDLEKRNSLAFRGREILGDKGNVYFDSESSPNQPVSGRSEAGDSIIRNQHLDAIYSSAMDGVNNDPVAGQIIVCDFNVELPAQTKDVDLGFIDKPMTLTGNGPEGKTYGFSLIELTDNEVLTVDTTHGPVTLLGLGDGRKISLHQNAAIRNIRSDGQPPRVGDLRILLSTTGATELYDNACIENVFLYSFQDTVDFLTTGAGCPSGKNTNFEGVIWAEAIFSSKNAESNRDIQYRNELNRREDTTIYPDVTSGIAVPDDVSSLTDLLRYTQLPTQYRFGGINSWQQVSL